MPVEFDANLDADVDLGADWAARWAVYKDVISFGSLLQSFASMTDVIMLSNWPIFMDAAGDVGNWYVATVFFYSFKVRSVSDFVAIIYQVSGTRCLQSLYVQTFRDRHVKTVIQNSDRENRCCR